MTALVCEECGATYRLSDRRERDVRKGRTRPVCPTCRGRGDVDEPGPDEREWLERLPAARRDRLLDLVAAIRL